MPLHRFAHLLLASLVLVMAALGTRAQAAEKTSLEVPIQAIRLGAANVFLIKADKPVLVDTGGKTDLAQLLKALEQEGVAVHQLAAVILTHGHADHAGLAAELKRRGAAMVVAGQGDLPMIQAGHNDDIRPTNFMAHVLKRWVIDPSYEPFTVDLLVETSLDLARWGLAGKLLALPGHTPGSLVVLLDDGRAIVGDMMLGGWLGGAVLAHRAGEHYFQPDIVRNRANLLSLLRKPIHTFYLGHGGPVSRESVLSGFDLPDPR